MKVYQPQCQVMLVKARQRTDVGTGGPAPALGRLGGFRSLDITPWLSDRGGVTTSKSVRSPSGRFSLTLEDRPHLGDSLYGLIEPQDIIEIRMEREAFGTVALVMRGLVSTVSRPQDIGGGTPSSLVHVSGQDFGKVLQQLRIYYLPGSVVGEVYLDSFKFFRQYNIEAKQRQAAGFVAEVCEKVINPYLQKMVNLADRTTLLTGLPTTMVPETSIQGVVSPIGIASFAGGSIYEFLAQFLDVGPFNELYVEDRQTSLALVTRPAPWKRLDGSYIQPGAAAESVSVPDGDLIHIDPSRSDAGVANYFWVASTRWELQNNGTLQAMALQQSGTYTAFGYVNTAVDLYGQRKMEVETQLGDPRLLSGDGPRAAGLAADRESLQAWLEGRRQVLMAANLDNVVLESGSMRLKGNERVRAGMYVDLVRGAMKSTQYATAVHHEFVPGAGFFTTVEFERGTGWVNRQASNASPWLAERNEKGAL